MELSRSIRSPLSEVVLMTVVILIVAGVGSPRSHGSTLRPPLP